jgi:hypothetical protein
MKKIAYLLLIVSSLFSDTIHIDKLQSDLFSKEGNRLKKIEISLQLEGRNLRTNRYKIVDALNIILSSFYIEDLFTSKGKERFKEQLKKYIQKKYQVDIDFVYLKSFQLKYETASIEEFINALKKEGYRKVVEYPRSKIESRQRPTVASEAVVEEPSISLASDSWNDETKNAFNIKKAFEELENK